MSENIFLFVPNLIGYGRVVSGIASLFYMTTDPITAMTLYWISAFLDAFDGEAARRLKQTTKFGAVLDMVSDRCTTVALAVTCAQLHPQYTVAFQLFIILDIASHWIHMYSSLLQGSQSHKTIDLSAHWLLRIYYTDRKVLFGMCAANELFFMAVYMMHFFPHWATRTVHSLIHSFTHSSFTHSLTLVSFVIQSSVWCVRHGFLFCIDFYFRTVSAFGVTLGLWQWTAAITFPFMFVKQIISFVQMIAACKNIGNVDLAARRTQ
eukprot:m.233343 g.233343  ORF g.233343 m.233343 type:complete len:264 (-) comp54290_c0_seq5:132-923(-)